MSTTIYNGNATMADTRDKVVFWDVDGTLSPYRYNDHVHDPEGSNNAMSLAEIEEGIFLYKAPSKHMQHVVESCGARAQVILGHCHAKKEILDKQQWVATYFPQMKDVLLVADEISKADMIIKYCTEHDVPIEDAVFVDDTHRLLWEAEDKGIRAFHVSSFLDWDYQ